MTDEEFLALSDAGQRLNLHHRLQAFENYFAFVSNPFTGQVGCVTSGRFGRKGDRPARAWGRTRVVAGRPGGHPPPILEGP